jgi:hypothetical protein
MQQLREGRQWTCSTSLRWMSEAFVDDYAKYRSEVPALIPFVN